MTQHERNRAISERREPVPTWLDQNMPWDGPAYLSDGGAWYGIRQFENSENPDWDGPVMVPTPIPTNWHADENWPALLREMPFPRLEWVGSGQWFCADNHRTSGAIAGCFSSEIADAVTEAWLVWKSRSGSEAR